MKTSVKLICMAVLAIAVSCAKTPSASDGKVSFRLSEDYTLVDVTKSNVSDYTALPDASAFTLIIRDEESAEFWKGNISDWDAETRIPAGAYTATATFGSLEDEGFDKPYFEGEQTFTVAGDQTSEVTVPVVLGNTVIRVECTEAFRNYFKEYAFSLVRGNVELAKFNKGEDKAAFVDAYNLSINGTFTNEVGQASKISQELTGLAPTKAYTCLFDVDAVGGKTITLHFNDTVETIDLGDFELN